MSIARDLVTDVKPQHAFDYARFAEWCSSEIDDFGELTQIVQISGGASNPTFVLTNTYRGETRRFVLRKQPPGKLLPSAHQVDREYRVMKALGSTDVPVPKMRALCLDRDVIGVTFYVMDFIEGRVFTDAQLPGFSREDRAAVYDDLNATLAKLHKVDFAAIGLADYGKPGGYFERQIGRWIKQYRGAQTEDIPAMERLIEYLPAHIPAEDGVTTIAHGDYRLQNTMYHPTEPRLVAVLDWELSTLGHPLADIAYNGLMWEFEPGGTFGCLKGIDHHALGVPTQHAYVAAYLRRVGRVRVTDWNFYLGFALFRLASIGQGVYRRVLDGNAASVIASHNRAPGMAEQAWGIIERGPCEITA